MENITEKDIIAYAKKHHFIAKSEHKVSPWLRETVLKRMNETRRERIARWWKTKIGIHSGEDAFYAVTGIGCIGLVVVVIVGYLTFWGLIISILYKIMQRL